MVGKALLAATLAGSVFYGYPLWNEHASTACQAVEQRFLTAQQRNERLDPPRALGLAVLRRYIEPISAGMLAAADAKHRFPELPPEIGCAATYWQSILDAEQPAPVPSDP